MAAVDVTLPRLYPKQHAVFFDPARIVVCDASTKAGKTAGAHVWQMFQVMNGPKDVSHVWVSPIYRQAKKLGYERMERMLRSIDPEAKAFPWQASVTDLCITFPNRSRIYYMGSENYDGIYGSDYHTAIVDEASRVKDEAWAAVRSTVTTTRGSVRIIGNVRGRNNWAWKLGRLAAGGVEGMAYHKLTAYDAVEGGIMEAKAVEEARLVLTEDVFNELYLCIPTEDGSNPFGMQAIRACVGELSSAPAVSFGVDLAKKQDYTVVVGMDESGAVCRFERWNKAPWDATIERIRGIIGDIPATVDSTGVGDPVVDALMSRGALVEPFQFTAASKHNLMQGLALGIHARELRYPDGPIVEELLGFEYSVTNGRVTYAAPDPAHDDCVVALALAWKGVREPSGGYFAAGV